MAETDTDRSQTAPPRRRRAFVDEGTYQVDLITALFSVFLILLIVSAPQIARHVGNPGLMDYQTKDATVRPFQLESFAPVYPLRRFWLVKSGVIAELNLEAVARAYVRKGSPTFEDTIDGVDIQINTTARDVDGFRLELTFFAPGVPAWITRERLQAHEVDKAVDLITAGTASSLIFVWSQPADAAIAAKIAEDLASRGKPHKFIHLEPGFGRIDVSRNASISDSELILRSY